MIDVVINGKHTQLSPGSTVDDVVTSLSPTRAGIAAAVNGLVVARSVWRSTAIKAGDQVEVLTAAQGG
ncbi:MAG: sulfur carrier protein ThiS [Acidimicrobiales bacterium]